MVALKPRTALPAAVLVILLGMAIFGPVIVPHSPTQPDLFHTFSAPTPDHPLGTDGSGRDVLSRTIAATRLSLLMPVCVVLISSTIGSVIGALSAALGGPVDAVSHRAMTVLMALPGILLGIVVVARFGAGTVAPVCAVALGTVPHIALLVRSAAQELLSRQFVAAYRLAGFSRSWIMLRRGLRHLLPVIGTQSLMNVGSSLLWLAGLSFLGLGVQPPDADWGVLIHDGRQAALRGQWWQVLAPTVCLAAFVLATHALAEGMRRHRASPVSPAKRPTPDRTRRHNGAGCTGRRVLRNDLLTVSDYCLDVAGRRLISGGTFAVRAGEIVCLVGPSGSGKSLLLASLMGRLPDSAHARGAALAGFGPLPGHEFPDGAGPAGADLARAAPAGADPAGADPAGADPAGADPDGAARAGVGTNGREPREHPPGNKRRRNRRLRDQFSHDRRLRELRRHHIGVVVQESRAGLNPMRRVRKHMVEAVRDDGLDAATARARAERLLADVGLPPSVMDEYPGRLSGGMAARVAIAAALMARPRLLLADEPTAALDVVTAAAVADTLRAACRDHGTGLLMTTHDEGLARAVADRVVRVQDGALIEETAHGTADAALQISASNGAAERPLVTLSGVGKTYRTATALDDVSLAIDRDIGLLGRSGSGKSTLAGLVAGLEAPTSGRITWSTAPPPQSDELRRPHRSGRPVRSGRSSRLRRAEAAQLVWQDPDLALDPLRRVGPDLEALVRLHAVRNAAAEADRSAEPNGGAEKLGPGATAPDHTEAARALLHAVGLPPETFDAAPGELSGGMRQRVVLARAMAVRPQLLILDEPTAQLDRETAARLIDAIRAVQIDYGITLLVISHDVTVLARLTERIVVLDRGRVVESGDATAVLSAPAHPRTRELIEAAQRFSSRRTGESPHRRGQDAAEQGSAVR